MSAGEIDVVELERWRRDGRAFVLLDVRESDEIEKASLPDAVTIPMNQLAARVDELDRTVPVAVLCHHGGRSAMAAGYLAGAGFSSVCNVDGGIDAYARLVDTSIPRY